MRKFLLSVLVVFAVVLLAAGCSSKKTQENLPDGDTDAADLDAIDVPDSDGQEPADGEPDEDSDADGEPVTEPEGTVSGSYMMPESADGRKAVLSECGEDSELASAVIKEGRYEIRYD
ncbi:hypothetical protein J5834_06530, partial [bacterium]|nr:hypothetical protein [bacterium]